ncbi:hypothetical protein [Tardibacter chloracetimidivorans]|uniref:hypothetical protein n=1 Tax=Tardibacter chloracetimidivorans TaxID=1921510 RepID=UPI001300E6C8|nr:hypothetical protein [Tardibacter chloracetimidivorans]
MRLDDDRAIFKRSQEIDSGFLSNLSDMKTESSSEFHRTGDFHKVASIPTVVVEKWFAQGFNIYDPNVKLEDIMKRIHKEDMEHFIATGKRLF